MATKHEHHKFNINDYTPKRFGLNYNPPQIILEYLTPSTGKLYHHKMRIHKLNQDKKTADIMKELYDRHQQYLDKKKVNPNQIIKLIEKIKSNFKPREKKEVKKEEKKEENKEEIKEVKNEGKKEEKKEDITEIKKEEIKEEKKEEKKDDDDDEDEYNFDEFNDEDLNKLSDEELNEKKNEMNKYFDKNSIKVGDPNYQYDVRKDFNHEEYAAEWDDDSY